MFSRGGGGIKMESPVVEFYMYLGGQCAKKCLFACHQPGATCTLVDLIHHLPGQVVSLNIFVYKHFHPQTLPYFW